MSNITIIPGSYKPPHKGHLSLVEKLIKKQKNNKIIIIITNKSRALDERFLYMEGKPKNELQTALIQYFPNEKDEILLLTKEKLIKKIKDLIDNKILQSINSFQSYNVWNIYKRYLIEKYNKTLIKLPELVFRIAESNSMIKETFKVVSEVFKEKPKKIILMKSAKNADNKRFDIFEKSFKKYIKTILFPNIKDIDATGMRMSILNQDKDKFLKYLPKDLLEKDKNKIWKICNY